MADSKKHNGSTWEHSLRKLTTATEAVENTLYSDGTDITSYTIKGNAVQNGTPTPSNPVMPEGCGDLEATGEHAGQYKIPISSGGVTTNIYLGSTQTVRQIKKVVLTGQENITSGHLNISLFNVPVADYLRDMGKTIVVCTHYKSQKNVSGWQEPQPKTISFYAGSAPNKIAYIRDVSFSTVEDFKAYLAQQYANGTPVIVWYVLQTATTGTVNEPLMKIGDYADTLSDATAIPTTDGANSITVGTTVQPSEFTATWTGWHNASVKEWDGSQWNE